MDGYYDYHPTEALRRPLVVTGFFGCGAAEAAGILSQRTGLAVADVDRLIEHERGCSLAELVLREGEDALRETEAKVLPRALAQKPPALVVLGAGALLRYENLRRVQEQAEIVYLREELPVLHSRVRDEVKRNPGAMYPFLFGAPASAAELEPLYLSHEQGHLAADHVVDVGGRSTSAVAADLLTLVRSLAR